MTIKETLKKFLPNTGRKGTAIRGFTWIAGDKILRLVISMFTGALVARYLKPEGYGLINALTAYAALFSPIANMGVNSILIRDVASHPENEKRAVDSAVILKLIGGITAFLLAIIIAIVTDNKQYTVPLVIISTMQFLFYSFEALEAWFYAKHKQQPPVIAGQISFIATSIFRVVAIAQNWGITIVLFSYALDSILSGFFVFFAAKKYLNYQITKTKFEKKYIFSVFKEAIPLILSGFGAIVYTKIDKVIMPWLTTSFVLGIYSSATRLSELWYFLPYSISTVFSPLIAEAYAQDQKTYMKRIQKSLIIMNLGTFGIAIATTIFGPLAINILFGSEYMSAIPALSVHIWSLPFVAMGFIADIWLINERLQKVQVARTFITAAVNILLNIILVPKYGALGAAWATLIAYTYPGFLANILDKRTRTIFFLEIASILPTPNSMATIIAKVKSLYKKVIVKAKKTLLKADAPAYNVFKSKHKKHALISYISAPFRIGNQFRHNNERAVQELAKSLDELGFTVDVMNYTDKKKYPFEKYSAIVGFGEPFCNSFLTNPTAKKIYYGTGMEVSHHNHLVINRLKDFYSRHGVWLVESSRIVDQTWSMQTQAIDGIMTYGNQIIKDSYSAYYDGPIYPLHDVPFRFTKPEEVLAKKKNWDIAKNNFFFIIGAGAVHKGFDIVLDLFKEHPEWHLHIGAPIGKEGRFFEIYKDILHLPNIHYYGFIDMTSESYLKLVEQCGFYLSPSVSEGCPTSVVNICGNGKCIPIATKESGLEGNVEIPIKAITVNALQDSITTAQAMSNEELEKKATDVYDYFTEVHSQENFQKELKTALSAILRDVL